MYRDVRHDGLVNLMTGLGDPEMDLGLSTVRVPSYRRSVYEYQDEWRDNPLAQREVSQVSGDIFREGVDIVDVKPDTIDLGNIRSWLEGDTTPMPDGSIDRTEGLLSYAEKVIESGDKVAGAALYAIVDDGLDPIHPLDIRRIRRVVAWEVLDRSEIHPVATDGTNSEPEYWMLSDVFARLKDGKLRPLQPGQIIHHTRLWRHKGVELTRREERYRQWWGASVLDVNWRARRNVELGIDYANTYLHRASWLHLQFAELNELLATKDQETGEDIGVELLDRRMRQFRRIISTMHIAVTDGGKPGTKGADGAVELPGRNPDKLESVVERTGDLVPIVDLDRDYWQCGTGMPRSIAFGEQASALRGGDNKGDWQSWQGTIDYKRKKKRVNELVNWMLTILFASREGPTRGLIPTQWTLSWRPLHVPSSMEKAVIAGAQADADNKRIEKGVVKAEEVRQQRIIMGDVEGQLRVTETPEDEGAAVVPPAQVGIAQAMLNGAMAVAEGKITPEFFASYLLAIDGERFSEEQAMAMARAAANAKPGGEPVAETNDGGSTVNAATLMSAGSQVAQGKMAPEFLEEALQTVDPETYTPDVTARLRAAAEGNDPDAPPPVVTAAPVLSPTPAPAPTADAELPAASTPAVQAQPAAPPQPEPKPDPFALLANIPDDLMTPAQIVEQISQRTPLPITTRHVHALAKKYNIRSGKVGGVMGYSANDVAEALAKENGILPAAAAEEPDANSAET